MIKYSKPSGTTGSNMNLNLYANTDAAAREFRAQRNLYITAMGLLFGL
jgi:hypothetical protein